MLGNKMKIQYDFRERVQRLTLVCSDNNKFSIMVGYEDIQYKNCGDSGRYVNVPAANVVNFLHILLKSHPIVAHVYGEREI